MQIIILLSISTSLCKQLWRYLLKASCAICMYVHTYSATSRYGISVRCLYLGKSWNLGDMFLCKRDHNMLHQQVFSHRKNKPWESVSKIKGVSSSIPSILIQRHIIKWSGHARWWGSIMYSGSLHTIQFISSLYNTILIVIFPQCEKSPRYIKYLISWLRSDSYSIHFSKQWLIGSVLSGQSGY